MKKIFASLMLLTMIAGASSAKANWFWQHDDTTTTKTTYFKMERPGNIVYKDSSENKKSEYNGNNSYKTIAGQVAVEDRMNDGDNTAFVVHPAYGRLNASLRQGDTGQSMATRTNHTFNN